MPHWDTVAIVGVGLIGGSIGLALRERQLAARVVGIGRRPSTLQAAQRRGAVTEVTTDLAAGVRDAQLTVVSTPVELIVDQVRQAAEHARRGALITDAGSTKLQIVRRLSARDNGRLGRDVHFVGSHPLAGSEKHGPAHAQADLFVERLVVVTPGARTRAKDVRETSGFWQSLGARVVPMAPQAHDRAMADVSHLPHLVAAALAAATPARHLPLAAGGWCDTTRVAAGEVELWRQIFRDNRRYLLKSLERFGHTLDAFRQALEQDDDRQLIRLLRSGKAHRDAVGS